MVRDGQTPEVDGFDLEFCPGRPGVGILVVEHDVVVEPGAHVNGGVPRVQRFEYFVVRRVGEIQQHHAYALVEVG